MDKIKSVFQRYNCFRSPSSSTPSSASAISSPTSEPETVEVHHHHAHSKAVRSPTPSLSRESFKYNNTSIVVSHGAFHTTWHYQLFCDAVQKYTTIDRVIVPQQSSSSLTPPANSFEADCKLIYDTIADELRDGRDVLLVCHSYGGIPGCEALADLSSSTLREKSEQGSTTTTSTGRVLGIVFVTAFVAEAGQSLVTSKLAGRASWVRMDGSLSHVQSPLPTLYNTCSPSIAHESISRLVPQSSSSFLAPTKHETWKSFPCYYVRCLHDQAMLLEEQNFFIARLQRFCPDTTVVKDLASDHAPFASMPERLAEVMEEIVRELSSVLMVVHAEK